MWRHIILCIAKCCNATAIVSSCAPFIRTSNTLENSHRLRSHRSLQQRCQTIVSFGRLLLIYSFQLGSAFTARSASQPHFGAHAFPDFTFTFSWKSNIFRLGPETIKTYNLDWKNTLFWSMRTAMPNISCKGYFVRKQSSGHTDTHSWPIALHGHYSKVCAIYAPRGVQAGAHLPSLGREPVGG